MLNFCTENQRTCLEPGFNCSTPGFPPWQSGVLLLKTKNWTPDPRYWGEKNGKGSHSQQELRKTQSQATDIHREFLFLMGSSCISQVNKNPGRAWTPPDSGWDGKFLSGTAWIVALDWFELPSLPLESLTSDWDQPFQKFAHLPWKSSTDSKCATDFNWDKNISPKDWKVFVPKLFDAQTKISCELPNMGLSYKEILSKRMRRFKFW